MPSFALFFFFNDTATTEIYTLSLHDALPISAASEPRRRARARNGGGFPPRSAISISRTLHLARADRTGTDRKSTRLNSSHSQISYAVFCLKKKNNKNSIEYTEMGGTPVSCVV